MVKVTDFLILRSMLLTSFSLLILTGCPGPGDRMQFDETAVVMQQSESVCFNVNDSQDYQPADMGINPRGIPSKEKKFDFSPDLKVSDGKLCIPPSYYHFPDNGQFIVEYVLKSNKNEDITRSVVVILGIKNGHIFNLTPTEKEISLPYCRYAEESASGHYITGACQQ
ncbi:putative T6SS immunity periplasmic lipoprotein [Lelliottia wanjuensis]